MQFNRPLLENVLVSVEAFTNDSDNETVAGAALDMSGYEGVLFLAGAFQGAAVDFALKAQQCDTSGGTYADLEGTSLTFSTAADANAYAALDIWKPQERYVKAAVVVPDITAVPLWVIAIQYGAKDVPVTQSDFEDEAHESPDEGTA